MIIKQHTSKIKKRFNLHPLQTVVLSFLLVIATGFILLMLPISSAQGQWTNPVTAFFTATSATCVTGLAVVNTGVYWSGFGQLVIMLLIQIGGLGFMSMAIVTSMIIHRTVTVKERLTMSNSIGLDSAPDILTTVKHIFLGTFLFEGIGAALFSLKFVKEYGLLSGIWKSVFLSISSFCNAGFDIFGYSGDQSSLMAFKDDAYVNLIIIALIIIGGLGFFVWEDILNKRSLKKISVYSKMVIAATTFLLLFGTVFFLCAEYNNPDTLGPLNFGEKIIASLFHSTTLRTAGFNTLDLPAMTSQSKLMSVALMFIGGSSGSTAGGIKTVTFFVMVLSVISIASGNKLVKYKHKSISNDNIMRSFTIFFTSISVIMLSSMIISFLEKGPTFSDIIYECVSAFGTVGVSTLGTAVLSDVSLIILCILMFLGRIGILTFTCAIMRRISSNSDLINYPKADLLIG